MKMTFWSGPRNFPTPPMVGLCRNVSLYGHAEFIIRSSRGPLVPTTAVGLPIPCAVLLAYAVTIVRAGGSQAQAFSFGISSALLKIALWPFALALVLVTFALIYYLAPDIKDQKWHWVTPGGLFRLGLWLAVSFGLKIYLYYFDRYSATYGHSEQ
jgi:hypothetical protein